jgi:DNA-binding GntR family transcriptional regulator
VPPTATSLALQIARLIRSENLAPGEPLSERGLAARFHVSRSPVRVAVQDLVRLGVLAHQARGGYCVADPRAAAALADCPPAPDPDEEVYLAIARDRLAALVPDRISENELLRRYGLTRPRLQALLRRMSGEGWVERLPGNGWRFLPVLTSMESYRQSYGFRQAIEPAALLDPGFRCNPPVLLRHLDQQRALVEGEIRRLSAVRLFEINSAMHEAIAECSGNAFFIESLKRVNRLRRLMEYGLAIDRDQSLVRCREHVRILELVLEGRTPEASTLMGEHLARLGPLKTGNRAGT